MGSLLAYSGLTTKVRSMKSKLIKDSEFEEISELTTVSDLVSFLQQHIGYKEAFSGIDIQNIHRGDIESILKFNIFHDFNKIYSFASPKQRKYLDCYFMKYEVVVLKKYLVNLFGSRKDATPYKYENQEFSNHSKIDTELLSQSRNISELIGNLKGTKYYEPLLKLNHLESATLFDYEMTLDLFQYSTIWKVRKKYFKGSELDVMTHSYGVKIDLLNIAWIYRAKKYFNISNKEIYALLIPVNYRLRKNDVVSLVETENLETFRIALGKTHYGKYLNDNSNEISFEQLEARILTQVHIKDYKHDPYSLAIVNTYLYLKEKEIAKIITATECIRYSFSTSETLAQLAK